ncbi:NAD(P)-binding protein [Polychaeton citri CBS 116435]|uniref:NAD(P)-binding protein n=1 Tax=Polychaeton citri CBS 116435 TaxID=1314669 RepID=A0A9P4Q604_9PEZI|nr:NAD(P)-binding protein [Polychaeton citri CBS 116435]
MKTVAFAGVTTGFGLTVLREFFISGADKKYKLILLSRSAQPEWSAKGADVRPVNYNNHAQLVESLRGVHTILSFIGGSTDGIRDSQKAIIVAAKEAGVTRFAPSEFAGSSYDGIDLYKPKSELFDFVKSSGLEYTRFSCGLFTNILATGTTKPVTSRGEAEGCKSGEEEALAGLRPWNYVVNMKAGTADLPSDGNAKMAMTDMRDVARFTIAALDLETWPEELGMRGDVTTFREIVSVLEKVQGRKFLIRENSVEEMEKMIEADPTTTFYNQTRINLSQDWGLVPDNLNKLFPDIKPITMEEFVECWWTDVDLPEPSWQQDTIFAIR